MGNDEKQQEIAALLSAYLDGELTPGQTEKVERLLAEDPQARQLLTELREVSSSLARLPREKAPAGIIEAVQRELERDALMGQADTLAETRGERRLAWRRFLAAAALFVLVGAIVTFVYKVLSPPQPDPHTVNETVAFNERPTPKLEVAVNGEPARGIDHLADLPTAARTRRALPAKAGATAAPEFTPAPVVSAAYNTVNVIVRTDRPSRAAGAVSYILTDNNVQRMVRQERPDQQQYLYAFFCPVEQFGQVLDDLHQQDDQQIDLVAQDPAGGREIVIPAANTSQAMQLAAAPSPDETVALANRFLIQNTAPTPPTFAWADNLVDASLAELRTLAPIPLETSVEPCAIMAAGEETAPAFEAEKEDELLAGRFTANAPYALRSVESEMKRESPPMADGSSVADVDAVTAESSPVLARGGRSDFEKRTHRDSRLRQATLGVIKDERPAAAPAPPTVAPQYVAVILEVRPTQEPTPPATDTAPLVGPTAPADEVDPVVPQPAQPQVDTPSLAPLD